MASLIKVLELKAKFKLTHILSRSNHPSYKSRPDLKRVYVFLAANYGNLGDVAITYAQRQWFNTMFPDRHVVNMNIDVTAGRLKVVKKTINPDDIVTLIGGGNMTDLYYDIELLRQMVVKNFPDHKIYSFPQTAMFSNTAAGRYLKRHAIKTYDRHRHITMMARERGTLELMQSIFPHQHVELAPDIVMTLDKREPDTERKHITLCLRDDAERSLPADFGNELSKALDGEQTTTYDTHIGHDGLTKAECEEELTKIWHHFAASRWVITDRLHGMIFAFITGTPAIVLGNNNHKVHDAYEWIKGCGYIHFIEEPTVKKVVETIKTATNANNFDVTHDHICEAFKQIIR